MTIPTAWLSLTAPLRDSCWTVTFFILGNKKILIALHIVYVCLFFGFVFDSDNTADECTAFGELILK